MTAQRMCYYCSGRLLRRLLLQKQGLKSFRARARTGARLGFRRRWRCLRAHAAAFAFPPLAGFIEPCLPRAAKQPPADPGLIHEIKHDGYRIMAERDGALDLRLATGGGYEVPLILTGVL